MRYVIMAAGLIVLSMISLFIGAEDISLGGILTLDGRQTFIMVVSRIPRLISILISGAAMSICGLIMQQLSRNKFVSPTTAGTMDAAALGIMFSLLLFPEGNMVGKVLISFATTLAATALFMTMVERVKFKSIIFVPLVGIIFGNILDSITTFLGLKFNVIQNMSSWLMGDFASIMQGNYELIYLSFPLLIITYAYANKFTIAGLGESFALSLGLSYRQIFTLGLIIVSVTTSIVVLTAGMIPFLGLIVPNIVSILFGDNLKKTLPLTAAIGAGFLLGCDILGRLIIYPYEIPISVTVGIIGGGLFLYLLLGRRLYAR